MATMSSFDDEMCIETYGNSEVMSFDKFLTE